jgi:hypothetical protein
MYRLHFGIRRIYLTADQPANLQFRNITPFPERIYVNIEKSTNYTIEIETGDFSPDILAPCTRRGTEKRNLHISCGLARTPCILKKLLYHGGSVFEVGNTFVIFHP